MSTTLPTETDFLYIDSDVPPGQTLREWRRERAAGPRRGPPPHAAAASPCCARASPDPERRRACGTLSAWT